jgi:hypothetical protein
MVTSLWGRHAGQPAVVMGGGPSLPRDLAILADAFGPLDDAVWISANEHGAMLRPVDYLVYRDALHQRASQAAGYQVSMLDVLREYVDRDGAMTISHKPGADLQLDLPGEVAPVLNSGLWAIYAAAQMGCRPILCAGMDCYTGDTYHHDGGAQSSSRGKAVRTFVQQGVTVAAMAPGAVVVFAGDSPLREAFRCA